MRSLDIKPGISFLLAAYNEEENVAGAVEEAVVVGRGGGYDFEVVVCDDGSLDKTAAIVEELARMYPEVRLVRHDHNRGLIDTFETLYQNASKDCCFTNATDRQVPMETVEPLAAALAHGDIVVGWRRHKQYGIWRKIVSGSFNLLPVLLFGTRTFDAGSVKLWPRSLVQSQRWISRSPFREAERLIRASRAGYRVVPVSIPHYPRVAGKAGGAKLSLVWAATLDVIRVWIDIIIFRRG